MPATADDKASLAGAGSSTDVPAIDIAGKEKEDAIATRSDEEAKTDGAPCDAPSSQPQLRCLRKSQGASQPEKEHVVVIDADAIPRANLAKFGDQVTADH